MSNEDLLNLNCAPPSAPSMEGDKFDEFDFPSKEQIDTISDAVKNENIDQILNELSASTHDALKDKVFAEADSSTAPEESAPPAPVPSPVSAPPQEKPSEKLMNEINKKLEKQTPLIFESKGSEGECPYYRMGNLFIIL
jgi:hypothetical protein